MSWKDELPLVAIVKVTRPEGGDWKGAMEGTGDNLLTDGHSMFPINALALEARTALQAERNPRKPTTTEKAQRVWLGHLERPRLPVEFERFERIDNIEAATFVADTDNRERVSVSQEKLALALLLTEATGFRWSCWPGTPLLLVRVDDPVALIMPLRRDPA